MEHQLSKLKSHRTELHAPARCPFGSQHGPRKVIKVWPVFRLNFWTLLGVAQPRVAGGHDWQTSTSVSQCILGESHASRIACVVVAEDSQRSH